MCVCVCAKYVCIVPVDAPRVSYKKLGFLDKFLELNKVMWETNKGLISSHPYDSRPEVNTVFNTQVHV